MQPTIQDVFAVFDRRLEVLRRLGGALAAAKPVSPAEMVIFLERRTSELGGLLAEWARIEAALEPWRGQPAELFTESGTEHGTEVGARVPGSRAPGSRVPVSRVPGPSADARARRLEYRALFQGLLKDLQARCRVEAAVLRRSRRTAAALSALWLSTGAEPTYAPAADAPPRARAAH